MTTSKTIRCASALRLIWLGRLSLNLHCSCETNLQISAFFQARSQSFTSGHTKEFRSKVLETNSNCGEFCRIQSKVQAMLWEYHFSPDTRSAHKRITHYTTHIKLPATSTKFHTSNIGHAALFRAAGCGPHRRVSCAHAKPVFLDRACRVHCGHSCFWSSHHHGLSPTAYAPKFRRAALV